MAAASAAVSRLKLFGSSVAHGDDRAFEAHVLAGQRVIEIHLDLIVGDIHHESVDAIAVRSHHRKHRSLLYHLGIKFPVYGKHVLFKTSHLIGIMRTECLGSLDSDVKLAAGLQTLDSLFKRTDHAGSNSEYYLFGILRIGLMHKILTRRGHFIEVVAQLYIFSGLNFFHIIICLIFLLPSRAAKTVPAEALSAEYRVKSPDTGRDYHHKENYGDPHGAPCARGIERLILTVGHIGRCASVAFIVRHRIKILSDGYSTPSTQPQPFIRINARAD